MSNTFVIITSVIVFLIAVLIPVTILMFVKKKLTPEGNVRININDERELEVKPGNSLLQTLADEQIFLPSACGGKGNCGMCKCQVLQGGGSILPTEKDFFSRKEQLSCRISAISSTTVRLV